MLVAGSFLGSGRVVAFSGQDFLGSQERATLVGHEHVDRLLANAIRWTAGDRSTPLRVLADNQRIADALEVQGLEGVEVVGSRGRRRRDWSASALDDADVAVVQVNEWGTVHLVGESVAPLRAFVERGGGLIVAGSARHWSWWIERDHGPFAGNVLLRGTGISWNEDSIANFESASTEVDLRTLNPGFRWAAYLGGGRLDATQMALLPPLFSMALELGRLEELDTALVRLVEETPRLPASADAPEARLAADVASSLGPHEWPETHPWAATFPGLPGADARRLDGSVVVDATWGEFPADARRRERRFPLGFYAPPGGLVTISVPSSHATGELAIEVGQEHDDLRRLSQHATWRRGPDVRRTFRVTAGETAVANAFGGSIALVVPETYAGTIPVTIRSAIPMAVYTAGESNPADWQAALGQGAPQAIVETLGGVRLVVSATEARRVNDPEAVTTFWEGFRRHHAELAGEPVPRAFESIWVFDPHVGHGYANAGPLRINYPLEAESWVLHPREGNEDWWLFGHELGHQWQTEDWGAGKTYPQIGEVAVNLFTMYTLNYYIHGGGNFETRGFRTNTMGHAALKNMRWETADLFGRLQLYRQLIFEFGWSAFKEVFASYYSPDYPRDTYGSELDGFAVRFSAIVERDLAGFFGHWEYPLSSSGEATIRGFGFEEWLPPGW